MKFHTIELPLNIFKLVEEKSIRSILIETSKDYQVDDVINFTFKKAFTRFGDKIITNSDGYEVLETIEDYKLITSKNCYRIKDIQRDQYTGLYGMSNYKIIYFVKLKEE